jgi:mRNA-degrading endonuclease RelE of RelBE toxin-antitoxin system
MYDILVRKKTIKDIRKLPLPIQKKLAMLIDDLRERGPIRADWPNYGRLGKNTYHCHLARKWVACWWFEEDTVIIEVYYAGSRENAPY